MAQMTGKAPASLLMLALFSFMPLASAHTARVTMDPRGISATFTALARVTCFDDGNGPPAALQVRLRDNSPPVAWRKRRDSMAADIHSVTISTALAVSKPSTMLRSDKREAPTFQPI